MKNVLIVEDKQEELEGLSKLLKSIDKDIQIFIATNLGEACECSVNNDISLFLIDIILEPHNINDTSGIQFVEIIRNIPRYKFVPVIFITSVEDPTYSAYRDLHCYSYINKPLHYLEAEKVIREALEFKHPVADDRLMIQQNKKIYYINKSHIIYICSKAGKMVIKTLYEEIDVFYYTCDKILEKLKSNRFAKCNRSTIINKDYIKSIDYAESTIELVNDFGIFRLGVTKKKNFMDD